MKHRWQRSRVAQGMAGRRLSGVRAASVRRLTIERLEGRWLLTGSSWGESPSDGEGESDVQVTLRLATTDLRGAAVTQVSPGSDFFLEVYVRDVRVGASDPGVYAAYLDVNYPADLLAVVPSATNPLGFDIEFGPQYSSGKWGKVNVAGLINEVGAFQSSFQPLGTAEYLLFRTRLTAGSVAVYDDTFTGVAEDSQDVALDVLANDVLLGGTALLTSNPADISPAHDLMTYEPPAAVPDEEVSYGQTGITITSTGTVAITGVTQPDSGGIVRVADDGTHVVYTPPADYSGTDSFTYTVGSAWTAHVAITVDPVNDPPVAEGDAYSLGRNEVLAADPERGVLCNDDDVEHDLLTVTLVDPPAHGNLSLQPDGSFTYTPEADYVGPDHFTYVAHDPWLSSGVAEVSLDIGSPRVSVRLELVDGVGLPVESMAVGDALYLRAWVRDLRDEFFPDRGVYAAYFDVLFDAADLQPLLDSGWPLGFEIDFGADYQEPGNGDAATEGAINEVGSSSVQSYPLGTDEDLLFEMPLETTGPRALDDAYGVSFQSVLNLLDVLANDDQLTWMTTVAAEAADDLPAHDVLLFEPRTAVPAEEILWTGAGVTIANGDGVHITAVGPASDGGAVTISEDGRQLRYAPAAGFEGTETLTYTVADPLGRTTTATVVVDVVRSWQNVRNPLDVNSDSFVTPVDALIVINYVNAGLPSKLEGLPDGPPFRDVNGDGYVTPIDALRVINYLNSQGAGESGGEGDGEGEGPGTTGPFAAGSSGRSDWLSAIFAASLDTPRTLLTGTSATSAAVRAWVTDSTAPMQQASFCWEPSAVAKDARAATGSDNDLCLSRLDALEDALELLLRDLVPSVG